MGRVATTTDPTGTLTKHVYDRLGRVTSTTDNYVDGVASGQYADDDVTSSFGYDAAGELIGYCPAAQVYATGCDPFSASNLQAWRFAFDDAGRLSTQTPPDNTTAQDLDASLWTFDVGGRLASSCDAAPGTTACNAGSGVDRSRVPTYDAMGRTTRLDTRAGNTSATLALRTDTAYLGDGQVSQVKYSEGSGPTLVDTIDSVYDNLGRPTSLKRGSTVISSMTYATDGTVATRTDGDAGAIGTSTFHYDWAKRLTSVDLPSGFVTASPTFGWRLDGLIGSRTWSGTAAAFSYDGAKRITHLDKGSLTQAVTYDRDGNVLSESRSLTGVSGDPGGGTQNFVYDNLNRVTQSNGLVSGTRSYTYDRDSNRRTKTEGGATYTDTLDRTDELVSVLKSGGTTQSFAYDRYGNLTGDAESGTGVTTLTYDLGGKLTGIDAAGTANDATFGFDALGRTWQRNLTGSTDTYSFVGSTETVARISNSSGPVVTDSIVDVAGDRLGVKQGSTVNWFLPDPHGDIAASLSSTETTVVNAIRYDAYGQTIATGSAGGTAVGQANWKYQGRLDVSPAGLATPLYDAGARFYAPGTGTFTSLDSVMGSAQDPLSMNRFLYAEANPTTLIDPSGHCAGYTRAIDEGYCANVNYSIAKTGHPHGRSRSTTSGFRWRSERRNDPKSESRRVNTLSHKLSSDDVVAKTKKWVAPTWDWSSLTPEQQSGYARVHGGDALNWLQASAGTDAALSHPAAYWAADLRLSQLVMSGAFASDNPETEAFAPYVSGAMANTGVPLGDFVGFDQAQAFVGSSDTSGATAEEIALAGTVLQIYTGLGDPPISGPGELSGRPSVSGIGPEYYGDGGGARPLNLSPEGAGRRGAFNKAKRDHGVPRSMQPTRVGPNIDNRGNRVPGRTYEFDVPGVGTVIIRDDATGHTYGPRDPQNRGPHFNVEPNDHYDYG